MKKYIFLLCLIWSFNSIYSIDRNVTDSIFLNRFNAIDSLFLNQYCNSDSCTINAIGSDNIVFCSMLEFLGVVKFDWVGGYASPYPVITKKQLKLIKDWFFINENFINDDKILKYYMIYKKYFTFTPNKDSTVDDMNKYYADLDDEFKKLACENTFE